MEMLIPANFPNVKPIMLYWNVSHEWQMEIGSATTISHAGLIQDDTKAHSYGHRWQIEQLRHVVLFKATDVEINPFVQRNLPSTPRIVLTT
jgi:hypothetical protein